MAEQPPPTIAPTTLILDYLVRLEAKIDKLHEELHTHIAHCATERRENQHALMNTLERETSQLRTTTAHIRRQLGRVQVDLAEVQHELHGDPFAGLELERAA